MLLLSVPMFYLFNLYFSVLLLVFLHSYGWRFFFDVIELMQSFDTELPSKRSIDARRIEYIAAVEVQQKNDVKKQIHLIIITPSMRMKRAE